MAGRYFQTLFWLCTCSGLGYGLLVVANSGKENVEQLRKEYPGTEKQLDQVNKRNQQFTDVLYAASTSSKPLYRMTKEEIEKEIKKP